MLCLLIKQECSYTCLIEYDSLAAAKHSSYVIQLVVELYKLVVFVVIFTIVFPNKNEVQYV